MIKVLDIQPTHVPELSEIRSQVGARMRGIREDALFDSLIETWMAEYEIVRYPERLEDAVYAPNPVSNTIQVGGMAG
jgi:hypothetical protein